MKADRLHELAWMSRPLMQAAEACVVAGLGGTGLTVRMRAVLEILRKHGGQTVPDIAAKLDIKRQYVQLMVKETLSSGLTVQIPNPRHKRSPLLVLTDRGCDLIEDVLSKELALMRDIGADFDEEDISTALEVVRAVTEKLKKVAGEKS